MKSIAPNVIILHAPAMTEMRKTIKKPYPKRIDMRDNIARSVYKFVRKSGGSIISAYWIGFQVADEIMPKISNNYRRRRK